MTRLKETATRETMFSVIEQWETSGLKKQQFCQQSQVGIHKFNYWLRKYKDEIQTSFTGFTSYRVVDIPAQSVKLTFPNGIIAEFPANTDFKLVRFLISNW